MTHASASVSLPTPLKTILDPVQYPFAVAYMVDNRIEYTLGYAQTLEQVYFMKCGWEQADPTQAKPGGKFIMVENANLDNTDDYSYWVAV